MKRRTPLVTHYRSPDASITKQGWFDEGPREGVGMEPKACALYIQPIATSLLGHASSGDH